MKRCLLFSILVSSCYLSMGQITATFKPNATVGKDACVWKFDEDCIGYGDSLTPANRNYGAEIINGDTCTDCMKLCLGDVPRKVAEINTETEEIFVPKGECLYSKNIHLEKGTNEFEVDCQTWQAGVYLLKITEGKNETSIGLNKQ